MLSQFCCVRLFATLWTVTHQAPLSMGFSRQAYCGGLPCPPPEDLPDPRIEPMSLMSPALAGRFITTSATWEVSNTFRWPVRILQVKYEALITHYLGSTKWLWPEFLKLNSRTWKGQEAVLRALQELMEQRQGLHQKELFSSSPVPSNFPTFILKQLLYLEHPFVVISVNLPMCRTQK